MPDQTTDESLDLYGLLQADPTATDAELQRAFRKQAVRFHPDKNPSAEAAQQFHLISIAIEILSDASKRLQYDQKLQNAQAAAAQREKIEGERRIWIEALEANEKDALGHAHARKRKREEAETHQQQLAQDGARLREALAQRRNAQGGSDAVSQGISSSAVEVPETDHSAFVKHTLDSSAKDRTVKLRFTREDVDANELKIICSEFGSVVELIYRRQSGKTQSALVEYEYVQSAQKAVQADGSVYSTIGLRSCTWAFSQPSSPQDRSHTGEAMRTEMAPPGVPSDKYIKVQDGGMKQRRSQASTVNQSSILDRMRAAQRAKERASGSSRQEES